MKGSVLPLFFICALIFTGCSKDAKNEMPTNGQSTTYVVISDLHLGDQRAISNGYAESNTGRDTIVAFFDYLLNNDTWNELIINGDLFDEWSIPSNMLTFADTSGNPITEQQYVKAIVDANPTIFAKLAELKKAGHKLVYVIGNHDMQVTAADIEAAIPGLFEYHGSNGIGAYKPGNQLFIEHGHRYDIFNAPYFGKDGIDNIPQGSILPAGFFIAKANTDSWNNPAPSGPGADLSALMGAMIEQAIKADEGAYDMAWLAMAMMGLQFGDIKTGTDGMTSTYSTSDYMCSQARLFKNINLYDGTFGWNERCKANGALFTPPVWQSVLSNVIYSELDNMGMTLAKSKDAPCRVVVWGHSHEARLLTDKSDSKDQVIYLNTGCWLDAKNSTPVDNRCFGFITANDDSCQVLLNQFSIKEGKPIVQALKSAAIKY